MKIINVVNKGSLCLLIIWGGFYFSIVSCQKYLDAKSDQKLTTPSTLRDLELVLNDYSNLNASFRPLAEVAADNYYLNDAGWGSTSEGHRNFYLWQPFDDILADWYTPYNAILITNTILESVEKIPFTQNEKPRWENIKGSALFYRGIYYLHLAQMFCKPFDEATSATDLGIPLRLTTNSNEESVRASVQATYDQILSDLMQSVKLLPETADLPTHPSKSAAYAFLARTYLFMRIYSKAGNYADSCLQLYNEVIDYNSSPFVDAANTTVPIKQWNPEVIFDARTSLPSALARTRAKVDSNLYLSYHTSDLRKTVFFRKNSDASYHFKGNYTGLNSYYLFEGIAVDEVYLTRAECRAREGNSTLALDDLNHLLINRWKTGDFVPFEAPSAEDALALVLQERRKELLFRDVRWSDLRRLNRESQFEAVLLRKLNGAAYELEPNSPRYVFLIDKEAIRRGQIEQNP